MHISASVDNIIKVLRSELQATQLGKVTRTGFEAILLCKYLLHSLRRPPAQLKYKNLSFNAYTHSHHIQFPSPIPKSTHISLSQPCSNSSLPSSNNCNYVRSVNWMLRINACIAICVVVVDGASGPVRHQPRPAHSAHS
jgi:hypothetical protein